MQAEPPAAAAARSKSASTASASSAASTNANADVKCPELLVRGADLHLRAPLEPLLKKGKRFESGWSAYLVAVYANTLFYYETADELPRGVVPLTGCSVKAVDRIFRNSDAGAEGLAEDCGPCWKVTSSAGRVLLFRSRSIDDRQLWIDRVNQANVEHPAYRRRLAGRRGSLDAGQGRRRRASSSALASRFSLDESPRNAQQQQQHRHSDASAAMLVGHEVSGLLRDAMQIVKRQKQEIDELKLKLQELQDSKDQVSAIASAAAAVEEDAEEHRSPLSQAPHATAAGDVDVDVDDGKEDVDDAEEPAATPSGAPDETPADAERRINGSMDIEIDSIVLDDDDEGTEGEAVAARASGLRSGSAARGSLSACVDVELEEDKPVTVEAVPPAPHSAPAQLERATYSESDMFARATNAVADASAALSASVGAGSYTRSSYSSGSAETDYLQQQAMELAEIARSLQSSFRTDFTTPGEGAPSSASMYIDSFGPRNSTTDMLGNDMFSFDDDNPFGGEDDLERLSEFDESDEHFLEASGILDSIQQVMNDFIVTAAPEKDPGQIIISDDVIAEIRQGIERKEAEEARRLRQLRSLSDFNDSSGSIGSSDNPLQRAKSARDFMSDFGSGGIAKMSRQRRDLGTLLVEESMTVVSCVLQTAGREEKMVLLYPLLRLFGIHNRLSRLIRWAIEIEVASVINVATLFRSDDYASRLVSTYSKCVGMDFIRVVLADPIRDILTLKIADLELNPNKNEALRNEAAVNTNAGNLMRACQHILDAILRNSHLIPSSYYHICSHLNSKVIKRFDGSTEGVAVEDPVSLTRSVIGGFLFLRFVCPAITTPHLYNLTEKEPPAESRRVLVLVTKLLFKTATCVMFGEREPQFKILNPFIDRNSPLIQQLFIDLSQPPKKDIDECFASDSRNIFSEVNSSQLVSDMTLIRSVAEKNLEEIGKRLAASGFPPQTTSELKVAVLAPSLPREAANPYLEVKLPKSKKLSVNKFLSFGKKMRKPAADES